MASFKKDMVANIAGSMQDRAPALIRGESSAQERPAKSSLIRQSEGRRQLASAAVIEVDRIVADPNQPRVEFDEESLERLARSLKERGQLQPVRVRWDDAASRYVVVVGERRWRAAKRAGLETLACVVMTGDPAPDELLEDQLVENCLREDLKPIEQARAFKSLLASRNLSQRQLAERLQVGQATIAKALALLNLPAEIQSSVDAGAIGPDVAYELTKVADPAEQTALARETAEGRIRRDEVKERVRARAGAGKSRGGARTKGKGRPQLPSELKHRGARGVRLVARVAARHTLEDVLADLEEFASSIRERIDRESRDAA
jgi:ParB family chromosome partitioning protein